MHLQLSTTQALTLSSVQPLIPSNWVLPLGIALVFVVIALDPATVLFTGFLIYALSGPVRALFRRKPARAR